MGWKSSLGGCIGSTSTSADSESKEDILKAINIYNKQKLNKFTTEYDGTVNQKITTSVIDNLQELIHFYYKDSEIIRNSNYGFSKNKNDMAVSWVDNLTEQDIPKFLVPLLSDGWFLAEEDFHKGLDRLQADIHTWITSHFSSKVDTLYYFTHFYAPNIVIVLSYDIDLSLDEEFLQNLDESGERAFQKLMDEKNPRNWLVPLKGAVEDKKYLLTILGYYLSFPSKVKKLGNYSCLQNSYMRFAFMFDGYIGYDPDHKDIGLFVTVKLNNVFKRVRLSLPNRKLSDPCLLDNKALAKLRKMYFLSKTPVPKNLQIAINRLSLKQIQQFELGQKALPKLN